MDLTSLKPAKGSLNRPKRIARGTGSGHGGTATRGNKGYHSRSGSSRKGGFEGGQMPLQRRLPKFGFKNISRIEYNVVNLDSIQKIVDNEKNISRVDPEWFCSKGLVSQKSVPIKILGRGKITAKLEIHAHKFSVGARTGIEKAGGTVKVL